MKKERPILAPAGRRLILWIGLVLLLAACLAAFLLWQNGETGTYAEVEVDGVCVARLPLTKDTEYSVPTDGGINVLVIRDGSIFMQTADCPDKTCVSSRAISRTGETIVCLPHRIVVTVKNAKQNGLLEVDAVIR